MNWRDEKCSILGCKRRVGVKKAGLCLKHYDQKRHSGETRVFLQTDPNEIITKGLISKVVLRDKKGKTVAEAIIDTEDVGKIKNYVWGYMKGYAWNKKIGAMHRLILPNVPMVDHINRNGLDNKKTNLRPTTYSKNSANTGLYSNSTSGFKGVSFFKRTGSWRSYITVNGKFLSLGYYKTHEEAAFAYDVAAIKYFGKHATTNKDLKLL